LVQLLRRRGLQLINVSIADSGAACEVIWYDSNNVKHVQVVAPGTQFIPGADAVGEPPVQVPGALPTTLPAAPSGQVLFPSQNYNGVAPTFIPPLGVGITWDSVTRQMWSYFNGLWH